MDIPKHQRDVREGIKNAVAKASNLKKSIYILKEIDRLTTKFQGDNVPISEVYSEFLSLPLYYNCEEAYKFLNKYEIEFIKSRIKVIKVFIMNVLYFRSASSSFMVMPMVWGIC